MKYPEWVNEWVNMKKIGGCVQSHIMKSAKSLNTEHWTESNESGTT